MARKSLWKAYFLWFFGGFLGLHHFYLGRDRQAFVWWMSCGGYFGIGWLTDFWSIKNYVDDYNEDPNYMQKLAEDMKTKMKPQSSYKFFVLQLLVGDTIGHLVLSAIPVEIVSETYMPFAMAFVPLGVAVGVHTVGNIGRQEGNFVPTCLAAYLTYPLYFFGYKHVFLTTLVTTYIFNHFTKQWRRSPYQRKPLCKRIFILYICGLLYLSLWGSYLYFNCTFEYENGETVKCRDAARHFLTSPMFREFLSVIKDLVQYAKTHGWKEIWMELIQQFDPQGYNHALKVLDLTSDTNETEITIRYRTLSRQWHPDKHKDPEQKEIAETKFIEIQQAYEILSAVRAQRRRKNENA